MFQKARVFGVASLLAIAAVCISPSRATAAGSFPVVDVLPDGGENDARPEVVFMVRDVRTYADWLAKQRELMKMSPPGRAYFDGGGDVQIFGFDWLGEAQRIAKVASPSGKAVPMGVVVFAFSGGVGIQGLIQAEPGVIDRIEAEAKTHEPWQFQKEGDASYLVFDKQRVILSQGKDGWLRMAPMPQMLIEGEGAPELLEGSLRRWVGDGEFALMVQGGGMLASLLAKGMNDRMAEQILSQMNALAVVWKPEGPKTVVNRIVFDHPMIREMRQHVRSEDLTNSVLPVWGKDAVTMASLSLPPRLLEMIPMMLAQGNEAEKLGIPPEMMESLTKLDGRLGLVSFGSPGDWALAMGFKDSAAASGAVPQLESWLKSVDPETKDVIMESLGDAGTQVLHMRPGSGLQGPRAAHVGRNLILVNQRSRMERLLKQKSGEKTAGPLTPPMRALLDKPAMAVFYSILSSDGSLAEALGTVLGGLKQALKMPGNPLANMEMIHKAFDHLPTLLAAGGFVGAMTYDVAGWIDVDDSVIVLQLVTSEI